MLASNPGRKEGVKKSRPIPKYIYMYTDLFKTFGSGKGGSKHRECGDRYGCEVYSRKRKNHKWDVEETKQINYTWEEGERGWISPAASPIP